MGIKVLEIILMGVLILVAPLSSKAQISSTPYRSDDWIEFPKILFNKKPVIFPFQSPGVLPSLVQSLNEVTTHIRDECTKRYAVNYHFHQKNLIDDLNQKIQETEIRVTCFEPELITLLDDSGSHLQRLSTIEGLTFDFNQTLAASVVNIGFNEVQHFPAEAAQLLVLLRNISRAWPTFTSKIVEWNNGNGFIADQMRLIGPWLTEFSSYSSLIKFKNELPCTDDRGLPRCVKLKAQIENILQLSIVRINNTPETAQFLKTSIKEKLQLLPQLRQIYALDTLISSTLDDRPGLHWADEALWISLTQLTTVVLPSLAEPLLPGVVSTAYAGPLFIDRLERLAKNEKKSSAKIDKDTLAARALAYGFQSIYAGSSHLTNSALIKKYINLKIFLDLEQKAEDYGLLSCTQCSQIQNYIEHEYTDVLLKETAEMVNQLVALIRESQTDPPDERN